MQKPICRGLICNCTKTKFKNNDEKNSANSSKTTRGMFFVIPTFLANMIHLKNFIENSDVSSLY